MPYDEELVTQLIGDAEKALAGLRAALATPTQPVTPPAPSGKDAIDLASAIVASPDCPNVHAWPILAPLSSVVLGGTFDNGRSDTMVTFEGRDQLPAAMGTQGPIAYTLWLGCSIGGQWYILPIVECIKDYVPTGSLLGPSQIGKNLTYYAAPPMSKYQPRPGETIAFFVTTGDTRRQNAQAVATPSRTNVVLVPLQAGTWTW